MKLDVQESIKSIHPWLSFIHLFLGEDKVAYDCLKYAMKPLSEASGEYKWTQLNVDMCQLPGKN